MSALETAAVVACVTAQRDGTCEGAAEGDWAGDPVLVAEFADVVRLAGPGSVLFADEYAEVCEWAHEDSADPGTALEWASALFADPGRWEHWGRGVCAGGTWSCWATFDVQATGVLLVTDAASGVVSAALVETN